MPSTQALPALLLVSLLSLASAGPFGSRLFNRKRDEDALLEDQKTLGGGLWGMDPSVSLPFSIAAILLAFMLVAPTKRDVVDQIDEIVEPPGWTLRRLYFVYLMTFGIFQLDWWERVVFNLFYSLVAAGLVYSVYSIGLFALSLGETLRNASFLS